MYTEVKEAAQDLSEAAEDTRKMYRKAVRRSPRMRKEITVRSVYYSKGITRHPCAESLFKLDIDCNLIKLAVFVLIGIIMLSAFCSMKKKKKS